ncbi:hypothetical protein [Cypionkella psychrotolerans]|uniref:hypothetical protein n=1 Tax=Cypionkella psychrotolerans TaxID=1678131 RepID=UPI0006B637EC|nr:hypothetical protein [Cypionkella psychrotolerans]
MTVVVSALVMVLFANAVIAFFIAFFWQVKVILTIFGSSDWKNANIPWKALGDQNSPQKKFGRFFAGEIFPELRRPWLRAITYVAISFVALFLVAGLVKLLAPEYLI